MKLNEKYEILEEFYDLLHTLRDDGKKYVIVENMQNLLSIIKKEAKKECNYKALGNIDDICMYLNNIIYDITVLDSIDKIDIIYCLLYDSIDINNKTCQELGI